MLIKEFNKWIDQKHYHSGFVNFSFSLIIVTSLYDVGKKHLTLSWRRPISYRNQSTDLLCKSMDWFLYDIGLHHERVNN